MPTLPIHTACALAAAVCTASLSKAQFVTTLDYIPSATETVLSTDFTQVTPLGAEPLNVIGGVFVFRNVTIPAGFTVRGTGSRPMIWIVTQTMTIDGTLSVDGDDGGRVDTLSSANFPTPGGTGNCSGGSGGRGSPSSTTRSTLGESGAGAFQTSGLGGDPGLLFCLTPTGSDTGSGGGGGSFATEGDPDYQRLLGLPFGLPNLGGAGNTVSSSIRAGFAGAPAFRDGNPNNDFVGLGFDFNTGTFLQGELESFRGGTGGGGGGDTSTSCLLFDPQFVVDNKGGGGGAGGGALIIYALGGIEIGPQGKVSANGGNGGGGEQAGSNNTAGGGGGGSGGMIILASPAEVVLHAQGETFANDDFTFSVSADGGIGTQSNFLGEGVTSKYGPGFSANNLLAKATGGFGGMGLVQFFTRVGQNTDGTNTHFDDFIRVVGPNGQDLAGADKERFLAWRGYFDTAQQTQVDDFGNPITVANDGDIRPSPKLLPLLGIQ